MKKPLLLFFVLFISFSFGQTKPNTNSRPAKESEKQTIKGSPDAVYGDPTVEPVNSTINYIVEEDNTIYSTAGIEVRPEFPGGIQKFYDFVGKNYKIPNEKGLKGKVYVTFVVEKDGTLSNIKVLRDIGYGTGEEAIRVLKASPKWSPGEHNGRKIRCTYSLPITLST